MFRHIEPEVILERLKRLAEIHGTLRQRISGRKLLFAGGIAGLAAAASLLVLVVRPALWMDNDIEVFNRWTGSLPPRIFEMARDSDLTTLDVEMLGHLSDLQRPMDLLESGEFKGKYLYNYGTVVAKVYAAIHSGDTRAMEEEEEAAEPPSFEFPVTLLANSARYHPFDEDARRNLELAIMWRESEDKVDAGEAVGDEGPPMPGFSRDQSPLQF
jgi:hypothetical protein